MSTISQVARLSGLSTATIRFYESSGLLPPASRTGSGYREYGADDLRRLKLVAGARRLGIPMTEIRELFVAPDTDCGGYVERLRGLLGRQKAELERQLAALHEMARELGNLSDDLDRIDLDHAAGIPVSECPCCPLIDAEPGPGYCRPSSEGATPVPKFQGEILEVLSCDIQSRPAGAPGIDELAAVFRSRSVRGGRFRAEFAPEARAIVVAFASAERICCSELNWLVSGDDTTTILTIEGSPEQVGALAEYWPLATVQS